MKKKIVVKFGVLGLLVGSFAFVQAQQVTVSPATAKAIKTGQTLSQRASAAGQRAKQGLTNLGNRLSNIGGKVAARIKPVATKVATKVAVKSKEVATKVASKVGDVIETSVTNSIEQLAERVALAAVDATAGFAESVAAGENVLTSAQKAAEGLGGEIKASADEALRNTLVTAADETQQAFILGVQRGAELVAQRMASKQLEQGIEEVVGENLPELDSLLTEEMEKLQEPAAAAA